MNSFIAESDYEIIWALLHIADIFSFFLTEAFITENLSWWITRGNFLWNQFQRNEIQSIHFIVVDTRPITFTLSGTQFVNHRDRLVYWTYNKEVGLVSLSHVTPPWLITKPKIYTFPTQVRLKPTRPNCVYNPVRLPKSLNVVISSADLEVQLMQLNNCDGVLSIYWNTLLGQQVSQHTAISMSRSALASIQI